MLLAPLYSGAPEIHYDAQRNPWIRDHDGKWVPYEEPPRIQQAGPDLQIASAEGFKHDTHAGKKRPRVHRASSGSDDDEPPKRAKGAQPAGSTSYGKAELQHMLGADNAPTGEKRPRVHCASSGSDDDKPPKRAKGGRPAASARYGKVDSFGVLEDLLPIGQKGWKEIEWKYNEWAKGSG
ncbi:hypothetical protein B0H16DRAFT_1543992 [Mycena metata]|uniref:Uncharacterized protein n=1 Tax=Mycena metata TaxID=1033252 RepID=A0AAD7NAM9_9AGAR|nr:hypothetical protein B0H16DRAFT_1543992 [Mycena metata]